MTTRDLINAIAAGDALEIENAFNSAMAEKVSARIDDMRVSVAQNLFAEEPTEDIEEELQLTEEETETQLQEVLSKDASAGDWISDFVNSDNPKFKGKSKEQRKQMALAAYYAKQRGE